MTAGSASGDAKYDEWFTPAEQQIIDAFPRGTTVDLPLNDQQRTVRAHVLSRLLTGGFGFPSGSRSTMKVVGARITGVLDLESMAVDAAIELRECLFDEAPNIKEAELRSFRLPSCHLPGLRAEGVRTRYDLDLNEGFISTGEVNLKSAHIGGTLHLDGALLHNPEGRALMGSRMVVDGALLARALTAIGQVRVVSARVGGVLSLRKAHLSAHGSSAFQGERLEVGEGLYLIDVHAEGRVLLQNARVEGGLNGSGAHFASTNDGWCLNMLRTRIGLNAQFQNTRFTGDVYAAAATIGILLTLESARFDETATLDLNHITAGQVNLQVTTPPGRVVLTNAGVELLKDDPDSWPSKLRLAGFTYNALHSSREVTPAERLSWLQRDNYQPQPYQQLITAYRAMGQEQNARWIALGLQRRRRRSLAPPARTAGLLLDLTVGYGYRTWLAGLWLLLFLAVGGVVFAVWPAERIELGKGPTFQPVLYTLDLLLPIVDLGQEKAWRSSGTTQWLASALILLGWGLTTAVIAGFTRVFTRTAA